MILPERTPWLLVSTLLIAWMSAARVAVAQEVPAHVEVAIDAGVADAGAADAASSAPLDDAGADGGEVAADGGIGEAAADAGADASSEADAGTEEEASRTPISFPPSLPLLPRAEPEPAIAPIVLGREALEATPPVVLEPKQRSAVVVRTLLGLLALLALAYLGSHARVQAFERRVGISQVITAGFPFVLLGLIARLPAVNILSDSVLAELSPVLRIGLGSIGFVSGFRLRAAATSGTREAGSFVAFATLLPFLLVMLTSSVVLLAFSGDSLRAAVFDPVFLRDAFILGTAGAMAAKPSSEALSTSDKASVLPRIIRLEEVVGMIGLAAVTAYFRPPSDGDWQLPGTGWLLLTAGLGTAMSGITYAVLQRASRGPEFLVLALGAISFTAGMAGYLHLSPLVVGFISGAMLVSFPGNFKERLEVALRRLERPIYRLSLIVIGALWQVEDWRGWALIPVFVGTRFVGKWAGTRLGERYGTFDLRVEERRALSIAPMGPLSIAIVVNAQLLYPGGSIAWIVAAVIGGAIITEIAVQLAGRRGGGRGPSTASAAISPEGAP